ncbi:MAG: lipoyl(octanoyl) transferase LipB [Proteobacteria bacterium]|nr:lipoyl(octanoyl) transferase LipB [Pseudomonadota bacterium]
MRTQPTCVSLLLAFILLVSICAAARAGTPPWFVDSFEGTAPQGWASFWNPWGNNITTDEAGTPSGGGQYTYHGPGQRVAYVMLDLKQRGADVRAYVGRLEAWLIAALAEFGVRAGRREGRVGVWVAKAGREVKIAAIGVRVRHWVTYHGVSLNVAPNLDHYRGIVPCGIDDAGVTSLADLGVAASLEDVDRALRKTFGAAFGEKDQAVGMR